MKADQNDSECQELNYFMNEDKSDFTFIVDGNKIPVIKVLLSLKSKVFEAMFSGEFRETKDNEIEVKDTNFEAFKTMIRFLYCDRLVFDDKNDYSIAIEVFKLGHKYELKRLMDCIEQELIRMITNENIEHMIEFYSFANFYNLQNLIKALNTFIEKNIKHFMRKTIEEMKRFNTLTDNYLMELIIKEKNYEMTILQNRVSFLNRNYDALKRSQQNTESNPRSNPYCNHCGAVCRLARK